MFIRNRVIRRAVCAVLFLAVLYTGVSFFAVLHKAAAQPYLVSGDVRYDFLGYYMMAAGYGGISIAVGVFLFLFFKKIFKKY